MGIKVRFGEDAENKSGFANKLSARRKKPDKEMEEERETEIEDSLSEIYLDDRGQKIDVNRMKIRRKQGIVFWFFNIIIFALALIVLGSGAFYFIFYNHGTDSSAVDLTISAPAAVSAGQEITFTLNYGNQEYVGLKNINIKADYPADFIYESADPAPDVNTDTWNIGQIGARASGTITVKGKIVDKAGATSIILAQMVYAPQNFSSQFKKDDSASIVVKDIGFDPTFDFSNTALVGQEQEINIDLKPLAADYLPEFKLQMKKDDNIQIDGTVVDNGAAGADSGNSLKVEKVNDAQNNIWLISGLQSKEENFTIKYKVKTKTVDNQQIVLAFLDTVGDQDYPFLEQIVPFQVMKSDLNLNLTINGANTGQAVNFGQALNYSIAYANKGEAPMENVVIMAVLNSDFFDWTTLSDVNQGREMGNTITWTKDEIPALAKVDVGETGTVDFTINVLPFSENDLGKNFKITSYAQYAVGGLDKLGGFGSSSASSTGSIDNQSNTITNAINSDLGFKEQVRYFDENNLPVGDGPLPPTVGQTTSFKVYWNLTNNLHDLNDAVAQTVLPEGVEWNAYNRTSVGTITYDNSSKTVTWQIGRLPITVFQASAEFDISLTPTEAQRNKIVVLVSGSKVTAVDDSTGAALEKDSVPKTTKLEDDSIAGMSSDGRVK
ncbi:MAG TPA: hypothetical protein VMC41_02755 [Candidatus Nanoarchaeia archaeon]|nr:hypothetical protein [Candidatus Nanoarchaeia archaeon]